MTCPACGKNNFKWAKRCDHCKAPLTKEAGPEAPTTASSEKQKTAASPEQQPKTVASGCGVAHLDPAEREAQVQAVTDRMKSIVASGQKPEWIFLCQVGNGATLFLPPVNGRTALLLFTSPLLALDYLRAIGEQGQVGGVRIDSIKELPQDCHELGVQSFCLNRCPRCQVGLAFSLKELNSLDSFLKIWALERASRFLQGQAYARAVLESQKKGMAEMKVVLEALRDHGGADNAHVYQLLAMVAQSQQDTQGRTVALARLKEFQLPVKLETDDFARGLSEGIVGLLATFELLRVPDSQPS